MSSLTLTQCSYQYQYTTPQNHLSSALTMTQHPSPSSTTIAAAVADRDPQTLLLLIPALPDDISLQILARVPLHHHRVLSLVSKPWNSTLRSPLLFSLRRSLFLSSPLLLLLLRRHHSQNPNPNTNPNPFTFLLLDPKQNHQHPILISPPIHPVGASVVSLGSKIYLIGGSVDDIPTNDMWVLDGETREWEKGPEMRIRREFAAAGVVNGNIYVIGGCVVNSFARERHWAEVYDPRKGKWEPVECSIEVKEGLMHSSAVVEGRVYGMADRGGVVFDPGTGEWDTVSKRLDMGWRGRAAVVDGVLYCYDYLGKIMGFDVGNNVWKELKGVEKGLPRFLCGAALVDVGGRLVVVWEEKGKGKMVEVFCAEIEVEKEDDEGGELKGVVVWSGVIAVVPVKSSIVHCLSLAL